MATTKAARKYPKEYRAWKGLRSRCNGTQEVAKLYREKGITVDPSWDTFSVFLSDMGMAPTPEHSIDRIDNSKGYSRENCRWATKYEQANNRDCNKEYFISKQSDGFQVRTTVLGMNLYLGFFVSREEAERYIEKKKGIL